MEVYREYVNQDVFDNRIASGDIKVLSPDFNEEEWSKRRGNKR